MGEERASEQTAYGPAERGLSWRQLRRQGAYLALTAAALALAALALGAVATALQATRDEARSADLALVLAPAVPPAALADHAFELYRRGYVPALVVAGPGEAGLKAQLVERGVPEASVTSAAAPAADPAELRRLARELQAGGATTLLVVTAPDDALRAIKIVRDQGLKAYGSPPSGASDPLRLAAASLSYWKYVLLGL